MTTEQTAQQFELAAQILRTGHPWGYRRIAGSRYKYNTPIEVVADGNLLIPLLATPTDNRPLHNPDNLTAEAVGVGYRLLTEDEFQKDAHLQHQEWWSISVRPKSWITGEPGRSRTPKLNFGTTYRLPLSVPWPEPADPYAELKAAHAAGKVIQFKPKIGNLPWIDDPYPEWKEHMEYREKPDAPFQLPPPPPGMSWHRMDGWKEGDLPQGHRPLALRERFKRGDQVRDQSDYEWSNCEDLFIGEEPYNNCCAATRRSRTTRPLTFEHAGKTWTYHRPGDPMPCDGGSLIWVLYDEGTHSLNSYCANDYVWGRVIGWRYAELQTKTVPLGPEDVPPGSVFRGAGEAKDPDDRGWCLITSCSRTGIRYWRQADCDPEPIRWLTLKTTGAQINRSLSKGQWNPDAWEPCHKKYDC